MSAYVLADVFTHEPFGGNQLAVFTDGGVPPGLMQKVARELNLSETVFVEPPESPDHHCRVRIFTPAVELPFAGHPTVGTACVLAATGSAPMRAGEVAFVMEEEVGPVSVRVEERAGRYSAWFDAPRLPERGPDPPPSSEIARMLGLAPADVLDGDRAPGTVSGGVPFLFVTVRDRDALGRIRLDTSVWDEILARHWAPSVYVVAVDPDAADATSPNGARVRARMFAPAMGVLEDPATGAAATALPGYLAMAPPADARLRWRVEQGVEMGRPSVIEVEARVEGGAIAGVRVGGGCVIVGRGSLDLLR